MNIRNAIIDDLNTIIALSAFVQQQHAEALPELFKQPAEPQHMMDAFRGCLIDVSSFILLAEETQPVGYLWAQFQNRTESWAHFESRLLYIHHMVVAPQFRQKGVGNLLLTRAVEIARKENVKRIELDVWSFNSEARQFYIRNGFEVFNEKMALRV